MHPETEKSLPDEDIRPDRDQALLSPAACAAPAARAQSPGRDARSAPRPFSCEWLGRRTYVDGLALQEAAHARVHARERHGDLASGEVLGLDHAPVITLGKRGSLLQDVVGEPGALQEMGIEVVEADRGGHATLHTPGQLVIYPILPLRAWGWGVRDYVEGLQTATADWLSALGVTTTRRCGEPGLYTSTGKIAFFGIRVRQGVSAHGISINVSNDLSLFRTIVSCGIQSERFDRLSNHGVSAPLPELFEDWILYFSKTFNLTNHPLHD